MADTAVTRDRIRPAGGGAADLVQAQRRTLLKRLMDVVALPSSVGSVQDRAIAGDLLLELLIEADAWARDLCAIRLETMSQAPKRLLRFLALEGEKAGGGIILENAGLDESDLVYIAMKGFARHRLLVAQRRGIGAATATALAEFGNPDSHAALLANRTATLSDRAVDAIVSASRDTPELTTLLIEREELRPAHALAMFWWCNTEDRKRILRKFSADRSSLIENCSDIFAQFARLGQADPLLSKAMQVVERRQRNRAALAASEFESLEAAIDVAARDGMTGELVAEISVLSGLRAQTGDRILRDLGGEGVAVLCKATGLKRKHLLALWAATGRTQTQSKEQFERVEEVFDMLAVAKAQTVLRYWNWAMESAFAIDAARSAADLVADLPAA